MFWSIVEKLYMTEFDTIISEVPLARKRVFKEKNVTAANWSAAFIHVTFITAPSLISLEEQQSSEPETQAPFTVNVNQCYFNYCNPQINTHSNILILGIKVMLIAKQARE